MVDRYGNRNVELLLVSDAGTVQNISGLLKQGIDAKTFSIGLQPRGEAPGSYPQLLVAVTSSQPLKVLQFTQPTSAQQLFPAIIAEAEQSKQRISVAARYFRLDH
jgi:serine/threonine-protein kinase